MLGFLPGPLVGLLVIWLLDRPQPPGLVWLYDRTVAAPVLAILVRASPFSRAAAYMSALSRCSTVSCASAR